MFVAGQIQKTPFRQKDERKKKIEDKLEGCQAGYEKTYRLKSAKTNHVSSFASSVRSIGTANRMSRQLLCAIYEWACYSESSYYRNLLATNHAMIVCG